MTLFGDLTYFSKLHRHFCNDWYHYVFVKHAHCCFYEKALFRWLIDSELELNIRGNDLNFKWLQNGQSLKFFKTWNGKSFVVLLINTFPFDKIRFNNKIRLLLSEILMKVWRNLCQFHIKFAKGDLFYFLLHTFVLKYIFRILLILYETLKLF